MQSASEALGDWYFRNGSPVMAACCHLAVDDCQVNKTQEDFNVSLEQKKINSSNIHDLTVMHNRKIEICF